MTTGRATTKPLDLTAARAEVDQGYPVLVLTIAGREARILAEAKPTLAAAGVVFLGSEFADLVDPIDFTPPGCSASTRLEGFTRDPRVLALWRAFAAGPFTPGPVEVPPTP